MALDLVAIKERIRDVIEAANIPTEDLREITIGRPYFDDISTTTVTPHLFIANALEIDNIDDEGTITDNKYSQLKHEVRFDLILVNTAKDGPTAEVEGDRISKRIQDAIEGSADLSVSGGAGIVQYARPERVFQVDMGNSKLARVITVKAGLTD